MTYGFRSNNTNGSTIISDQTYNPVYVGNASLVNYYVLSQYGVYQYNNPGKLDNPPGTSFYYAWIGVATYTITLPAGTTNPLAFIKNDAGVGWGCAIAWTINTSGTTWEIGAWICGAVPNIMVFASPQNSTPTGNGMLIRKADGKVAFNSNYKHLIPASVPITTVPYCQNVNFGSGNYRCNYYYQNSVAIPNLPANAAFLFSSPITSNQLSYYFSSTSNGGTFYAGIGKISGGNFITTLGSTNQYSGINSLKYDIPRNQTPIVIIDASKYY